MEPPLTSRRGIAAADRLLGWCIDGWGCSSCRSLAGEFTLTVLAVEIMIIALFAASLHFIMGPGGMVSFGHAAYFGLGAYGAALAGSNFTPPYRWNLASGAAAPLVGVASVLQLLFGWFCVRLSGVYLAMLTLAALHRSPGPMACSSGTAMSPAATTAFSASGRRTGLSGRVAYLLLNVLVLCAAPAS